MDWRIAAVIAVIAVATAVFVIILRSNRERDQRGREEAEARGEEITRKAPNLTVLYLLIGGAFLVVGVILVATGR